MRYVVITAAALAVGGFIAATPASAQTLYYAGGPKQVGNSCSISDGHNDGATGYMAPCPKPQKVAVKAKKKPAKKKTS